MTKAAATLADLAKIPGILDQIRAVRDQLDAQIRQARASENWSDSYKEKQVASYRDVAKFKIEGLTELIDATRSAAASKLESIRTQLEPTGAEALAVRMEAADARSRVRGMMASGKDHNEVLALAIKRSDRLMIEAVKEEARWNAPDDLDGFNLRADRALVTVVDSETADVMRGEYQLRELDISVPVDVSRAASPPSLAGAIDAHYARQQVAILALEPVAETGSGEPSHSSTSLGEAIVAKYGDA